VISVSVLAKELAGLFDSTVHYLLGETHIIEGLLAKKVSLLLIGA
jgi:hypothetical protein